MICLLILHVGDRSSLGRRDFGSANLGSGWYFGRVEPKTRTSLDVEMDARRRELGLRWRDVADRAGLSEETIRLLRRGAREESIRATDTEAKIEEALGWLPGSIRNIRHGLPPTVAETERRFDIIGSTASGYPTDVAGDRFLESIWDQPALEDERRAAIDGVIAYRLEIRRRIRSGGGIMVRRDGRRQA